MLSLMEYLFKLPLYVFWNFVMISFWSFELILKNWKKAWDPRTWITLFLFYFIGSMAILFLVEIPLDLLFLLIFGRTLTDLIPPYPNWIVGYALSSFLSTALFTLLFSKILVLLTHQIPRFPLFRTDVLDSILEYNKAFIRSRLKRTIILTILGILIYLLLS